MAWFQFNLKDFAVCFLSLLFEGVPFLFIGTFLSGLVEVFVPAESLTRWVPRHPFLAICASALLGNVLPMCECGVVPVIRRLLGKGLPVSCGLTYLLAAPIINPIVAMSTYAAFRGQAPVLVTGWRLALGFLVAISAGCVVKLLPVSWVLNESALAVLPARRRTASFRMMTPPAVLDEREAFGPDSLASDGLSASPPATIPRRLVTAVQCAAFDFLDVGFYMIIGALLASVFDTAIDKHLILPLASHAWLATAALMALAWVLSLCSTSDAFIAATFVGFSLPAKLAFMTFGPMMDFKLMFMYGFVFRRRFTALLALGLAAAIGFACVALRAFIH